MAGCKRARTRGRTSAGHTIEREDTMEDEKKTKKAPTPKTKLGEFPMGDCFASAHVKADREPTKQDLRRAATACRELAQELEDRAAMLEGQSG
jgi:hypothetical protein